MNKKKSNKEGIVFSTDPDFFSSAEQKSVDNTLQPASQKIRVKLDTRHRSGKAVTLIQGFIGKEYELEELGKKLKTFCGTGGSVKDAEVIIQGDQREKVMQWLIKNGFTASKRI